MELTPIIQWLAPIASALVICAGQLAINARFKRSEERHEQERQATAEKRAAEAAWRDDMERRMDEFEAKLAKLMKSTDLTLKGQITQMRSDIIHKAHRYLDDLGCASTEEKNAFDEEYKEYCTLCETADVYNDFVGSLHKQVMALPGRQERDE